AALMALCPPEIATRIDGPNPPGLWPEDQEFLRSIALKRDPDKAKELFAQLVAEGVMPKEYRVQVTPPPDDARGRIAEVMVTNLKELGVDAEVLQVDWATYLKLLEQSDQSSIYMLGTTPAIPDPDAVMRWLFSKDGAHGRYLNIGQFSDYPAWDAELKTAQASQNREERARIYRELARTMMQLVMHVPLYTKDAIMA